MNHIELLGASFELKKDNLKRIKKARTVPCKGNACSDIDYQWDNNTNSFHFFNDGNKKILLKVTSATYFGCSVSKTKRLRPYEEWDTGFYGICEYEANYR